MSYGAWLKRAARKALLTYPCYRTIPIDRYKDYAATTYFSSKGAPAVHKYISATGRIPRWKVSTLEIGLSAAFECADDQLAHEICRELSLKFPERILSLLTLSDVERYHGNTGAAYDAAKRAWFNDPASEDAASRVVALAYRVETSDKADDLAIKALVRFPRSSKVLWTVCKGCTRKEQFARIEEAWRGGVKRSNDVAAGVRQMANAAIRAEEFDTAMRLYAEGCLLELYGLGVGKKVSQKSLKGKNGLSVIRDITSVLNSIGTPFFLAAGTALGLVRDGRPLDHDNDIDVGIFEDHWDRGKLIEAFSSHPHFDFDVSHPKSSKVGLMHRGGAAVDIFKFYTEGGGIYHDAVFVRWENSPFKVKPVKNLPNGCLLPEDTDRYLAENYGEWRIPDSSFDAFVDGPNVEVTWHEYFVAHRMRRAYKYVRAMELIRAREELRHVRSELKISTHGRQLIEEMRL